MSGALHDGRDGLREVVDRGGRALVQDPREALVPDMPAHAIAAVPEAEVAVIADDRGAGRRLVRRQRSGGHVRGGRAVMA